jgi:pantothenate kinase-related protein Tda10
MDMDMGVAPSQTFSQSDRLLLQTPGFPGTHDIGFASDSMLGYIDDYKAQGDGGIALSDFSSVAKGKKGDDHSTVEDMSDFMSQGFTQF